MARIQVREVNQTTCKVYVFTRTRQVQQAYICASTNSYVNTEVSFCIKIFDLKS